MADEENTYMHFEEESIIYIWSKFQLDTCMFDSYNLLTKFGPGFWYRALVPGFFPSRRDIRRLGTEITYNGRK